MGSKLGIENNMPNVYLVCIGEIRTHKINVKFMETTMLRNIASLESKVGEWSSQWLLANNTPIDVCIEMMFQYQRYLFQIQDQQKAQQQQQEAEEKAKADAAAPSEPLAEAEVVAPTEEA